MIVFRSALKPVFREDLSGPDSMVIQLGNLLVYNVYLLPETSPWVGRLEKDPCEALAASLALAYTANYHVALFGDLDARTVSRTAHPDDSPRTSMGKGNLTARGRWLCEIFEAYDLVFVGGAQQFGLDSGKFTSFQGKTAVHKTVIDYAVCSRDILPKFKSFGVADRELGYHHAAISLCLETDIDMQNLQMASPRKKRTKRHRTGQTPHRHD